MKDLFYIASIFKKRLTLFQSIGKHQLILRESFYRFKCCDSKIGSDLVGFLLSSYRKFIFVSICFIHTTIVLFSQEPYKPDLVDPLNEPWRWTIFEELGGKGVRCITESSDGNIWFGVDNGLIRYNGHDWKEYSSENGFTGGAVLHLVSTGNNTIYAGTNNGLYIYNMKNWAKVFPLSKHSKLNPFQTINKLKRLRDGKIIASVGSGLYSGIAIFHDNKTTILASQKTVDSIGLVKGINLQVVPDDKCINGLFPVEDVFQDKQDRVWVWASEGFEYGHVFNFILNNNIDLKIRYSKNHTSFEGLIKGDGSKFGQDENGHIWMVNNEYDKGISVFNGSKWDYFKLEGENSHLSITNINGDIWIGGFAVIKIFKDGKWRKYQRPLTPIPDSYIKVYKDNKGYLWIIGTQNEVIRIDYSNTKWSSYKSLNFQCEDKLNNLWFLSVDGEVVIKKENGWFSYETQDGLPDAPIRIYCTRNGQICVAGSFKEQASVSFLKNQKWERQVFPELSWGIDYRAIFEDADGNLWIGASVNSDVNKGQRSGVIKLVNPGAKNQKKVHYMPQDGIGKENAYGIAQTKDGTLWLGGTHLNYFSDNQWKIQVDIEELTQYSNCLGNTPSGELWVGSRLYGVFVFSNNNWRNFNIKTGLKSNSIISILPVSDNDVWIATNRDFSRYDGKSWTNNIFPENFTLSREGGDIKIQPDGTLWINRSSREWKRRALNNNQIEKEDADYFSTFSYKPDTLKPNTKISFYSSEVPSDGNTFIEWTGSDEWQSARDLKLQYSYRLNDNEWSDFSYKNNITFLDLKNGEYSFEVRARDIDFNIDPSPDIVNFVVLPPVWKQTWFISLILIFLVIIIIYQVSAVRRKQYLERLNLQLEKHSDEIEHKNLLLEKHSDEIVRKNSLLEKQKDQILQQNLLEKERNLSKIRFFTNISHEFRTPLTIVAGIVDSLTENTQTDDSSFLQNQLTTVKKHTNRLLRLINQLMDFRKMETESLALRISESDLVAFLNDICYSFNEFAQQHNIEIVFKSNVDLLMGWFDRDKIEKISYNLISNAIKYTPEGGSVFVKLISGIDIDSDSVEIIIEDTGKGIAENEIKKIFEPFYQAENVDGSKNEGTGIGLSLVNNLVSLHHGKMQVVSSSDEKLHLKNGYSTRFTITLSMNKTSYKDSEIVQMETQTNSSIKDVIYDGDYLECEDINESIKELELPNKRTVPLLVVVEDNNDLRRFMVNSLNNYYKVVEASNGLTGFELVVKYMPDLIISDIMMPQMSGTEFCEKIKNDVRTSHIPIILLTARTTDENKIEGFEVGADDYITKPFNVTLLITRINNIIASHLNLRRKFKNEEYTQPDEVKVSSLDTELLKKVRAIVEKNYHDNLFGVSELSNEIGISGRHLLFKLQNLLDTTPVEYIRAYRLKMAAQLLVSKKASISEIVYETGFNDISYFGKCFNKYYGMSPSKYIKTYYKRDDNII